MKRRVVAIVLVSLFALSASARAQVPRLWHVGFAGGMSLPVSDARDALKNGFHGQGFLGIDIPKLPLGLRAALDYERFDLKGLGTGTTGTGTLLGGMANGLWHFPAGPVKPYLSAGLGGFNVKSEIDSSGASVSASKIHFAVNAGEGVAMAYRAGAQLMNAEFSNTYTFGFAGDIRRRTPLYLFFENALGERFLESYYPEVKTGQKSAQEFLDFYRIADAMTKEVEAGRGPIYIDFRKLTHEERSLALQS